MKKISLLLICLFGGLLSFSQSVKKMTAAELNSLIVKSEKPMVVSFWATWCSSCVEEIPYFISTIKEKYNGQVDLLLVSLDIKSYYPQRIEAFAAKRNFNTSIAWLSESNADIFCPIIDSTWSGAIPSTLMVNNRKQYRKFYEIGMTERQFINNVDLLIK